MATKLRKSNKKGFTLVELVIVIAVLAILAAIAIPTVTNVIETANTNTDAANCQTIELALKSADAENAAGTWTGSTVEDALKHEGLNLTTLQGGIKTATGTDKVFYYGTGTDNKGKIYVKDTKPATDTDSDVLAASTTLANFIGGTATP